MGYELFYWASIQGRGEFVRLALEEAAIPYVDVARSDDGEDRMLALLGDTSLAYPPFAPPFLRAGRLLIGQTANILLYLGERHGLAPKSEVGRLWTHQLQLTLADFVVETHDTHHPIAGSLYYEDQRPEAKRRASDFGTNRLPEFFRSLASALLNEGAPCVYVALTCVGRGVASDSVAFAHMSEWSNGPADRIPMRDCAEFAASATERRRPQAPTRGPCSRSSAARSHLPRFAAAS